MLHNDRQYAVHLLEEPEPGPLAELQAALAPHIHLTWGSDPPDAALIRTLVGGRPSRQLLLDNPQLQRVVIPFAGVPLSTRALLAEFPHIALHNLHHNAGATAELAVALLMAAAKFVVPFDQDLRRGDWSRRYQPSPSMALEGKTALVLGFGKIGQRIGRACHALGMRVLGLRRHPEKSDQLDYPAQVYGLSALAGLLPAAHVLAVALPSTPETDGLVGASELALLPPGSVLVNVGRGSIIDQAALYTALKVGPLRAAGLDVWYNYPADEAAHTHTFPGDYPFHELENLVLSPHRGGDTDEIETLRMQALAELLNAAAAGQPVPNRVDLALGY